MIGTELQGNAWRTRGATFYRSSHSFDEVIGPHLIIYSDPVRTAELIVEHAR